MNAEKWFAARCFFLIESGAVLDERGQMYEERITLWRAGDADDAMKKALEEAQNYAEQNKGFERVDHIDTYELYDEPCDGAEVWSTMRDSWLAPTDYVKLFVTRGDPHASQASEDTEPSSED